MKHASFRAAVLTGLLAFGGITASAQSNLIAKVPFAFGTPAGGNMPAGTYVLTQIGGSSSIPTYRILNISTKKSVLARPTQTLERSDDLSQLVFRCAAETCALSGVFPGGSRLGYVMPFTLKTDSPATEIAEIRIPMGE